MPLLVSSDPAKPSVQLDHYVLCWCESCRCPSSSRLARLVLSKVQFMQAGDARLTDTRQDEQDRCITIKSTGEELDPGQSCTNLHLYCLSRDMCYCAFFPFFRYRKLCSDSARALLTEPLIDVWSSVKYSLLKGCSRLSVQLRSYFM